MDLVVARDNVRPQEFYLKSLDRDVLRCAPEDAGHQPYIYVCVPAFRELIIRAAMAVDGVPGANVLQVWLDVGSHLSGGEARDEEIRHRVSTPSFEERR